MMSYRSSTSNEEVGRHEWRTIQAVANECFAIESASFVRFA